MVNRYVSTNNANVSLISKYSASRPSDFRSADDDAFEVDGIKLDPENQEFKLALQYALESNRNIYLTGKAGSGKTTFLKYLRKVTKKNIAVVAPTGVAAVNADGQTIHSFFNIPPSIYAPDDKRLRVKAPAGDPDRSTIYDNIPYSNNRRSVVNNLELLVIDEISMVRADLLDVVDTLLRVYRRNSQPFGGVQVIMIGDTFQLPPVVVSNDREVFRRCYDSEFFFHSKVIQRRKPLYIELKKIYRQTDKTFVELLNRVRVNQMRTDDFNVLKSRYNPGFQPKADENYITLVTKNARASTINDQRLDELCAPKKSYHADVEGDFPTDHRPTDTDLCLKVGAQVMFVKNDMGKRFYNGMIGTVAELHENEVVVRVDRRNGESNLISVRRETWQNKQYSWDEKEKTIKETIVGSFTQFPLRLAWAITVHKSQGLTFEKVIADVGDAFASGQVYVALSRCTSLDGLVLRSPIIPNSIKTDRRVLNFAQNETPETLLIEQLSDSKADYYYSLARKAFRAHDVSAMLDSFYKAIKLRNDVGTDTFRRYVSTWSNRLFDEASSVKKLKENSDAKESKIVAQKTEIVSLRERNVSLQRDLHDTKEAKQEVENELQALREKISQLSEELDRVRNIKWYEKLFGKK